VAREAVAFMKADGRAVPTVVAKAARRTTVCAAWRRKIMALILVGHF